VVRVGNLSDFKVCQGVDVRLRTLCFIHEIWGASLKTPWPKHSLGKKDQVRKKSTLKVTSIRYNSILTEVKFEMGHIPCVGYLFA